MPAKPVGLAVWHNSGLRAWPRVPSQRGIAGCRGSARCRWAFLGGLEADGRRLLSFLAFPRVLVLCDAATISIPTEGRHGRGGLMIAENKAPGSLDICLFSLQLASLDRREGS